MLHAVSVCHPKHANYAAALLDNQHRKSNNLFEGILTGGTSDNIAAAAAAHSPSSTPSMSMVPPSATNNPTTTLPLKRTVPSLYWMDDDTTLAAASDPSSSAGKRFHVDPDDADVTDVNVNGGSLAALLGQLPQTPPPPPLHQQQHTMLGALGDTIFRQAYHLPGIIWYS